MLGNFSFGDYFKKDAIAYAWELLTEQGVVRDRSGEAVRHHLRRRRQGVPRDEEAYNLWLRPGVPAERVFEMGLKDNFWQMGDTGPCGPCSEIFYDFGVEASETGRGQAVWRRRAEICGDMEPGLHAVRPSAATGR